MAIPFEEIGIFDACGRRRSAEARRGAESRRLHDLALATRCESLGINPYRSEEPITAVDILTEGQSTNQLGKPVSRRRFFHTIAAAANRDLMRLAEAYFKEPDQSQVYELIVRPKAGKPTTRDYRNQHFDHVARVGAACKEVRRLKIAVPLLVVRHPRPIANGHAIDLHTHILVESTPSAMDALVTFLATRFATDEKGVLPIPKPVGRVAYLLEPGHWRMTDDVDQDFASERAFEAVDGVVPRCLVLPRRGGETGFEDGAFTQFWEQTSVLRWVETVGSLRRFRADNVPKGHRLTENALGEVVAVPATVKTKRSENRAVRFTSGPIALAVRLSWIDDVLRPVVLVRGWTGCWRDLSDRYDLRAVVRAAAAAWDRHPAELEHVALTNSLKPATRKDKVEFQHPYWLASRGTPWDYRHGPPPWAS